MGVTSASASPLTDQVTANPSNPSWFFRPSGEPIFICGPGDPEGFFYRGTENSDGTRSGDQDALIARLAPTGANSIYVIAVRSHGGDGDASQNPFVNHDPAQGVNDTVLDQWHGWVSALDDAGVVTHLFLYDDSARPFDTGDNVSAAEEDFIRAMAKRFEDIRNLVWCVAEEYSEALSTTRASRIAEILRDADDHDHPIAVHQVSGLSFDFAGDPSVDQFSMQYNVATASAIHAGVVQAFASSSGRYQLTLAEAADWGTGAEARRKAWAAAMGGAYVMVLGMDIVSTPTSDLEDCGRLVHFFEQTGFPTMAPLDDLARSDTKWVLAEPGRGYILYADSGTGSLGMAGMPEGYWDLLWFNPVTGATVEQTDVATTGGTANWARPGGIGGEAAVWISRSGTTGVEQQDSWAGIKAAYR
ncbi:MAG: DUF4038 domain-containing protein [Gemmatimonadetes bacterium]|nr:DUF4038 domain-containing protein [Gemmatimonadota bacterium]